MLWSVIFWTWSLPSSSALTTRTPSTSSRPATSASMRSSYVLIASVGSAKRATIRAWGPRPRPRPRQAPLVVATCAATTWSSARSGHRRSHVASRGRRERVLQAGRLVRRARSRLACETRRGDVDLARVHWASHRRRRRGPPHPPRRRKDAPRRSGSRGVPRGGDQRRRDVDRGLALPLGCLHRQKGSAAGPGRQPVEHMSLSTSSPDREATQAARPRARRSPSRCAGPSPRGQARHAAPACRGRCAGRGCCASSGPPRTDPSSRSWRRPATARRASLSSGRRKTPGRSPG